MIQKKCSLLYRVKVGTLWVHSWLGQFLWRGSFWISVVFPLVLHLGISFFCMHLFISVASLSCMGVNFINQNPCKARGFPVGYLLKCCIEPVAVYVHLRAFLKHSQLCFCVVYPFDLFVMIFPFPYFAPKSSGLSRIQLSIWLHPFHP